MEIKKGVVLSIFLLLLLMTAEVPMGADARICEAPSHRFRGLCWRSKNCATICHSEDFHSGKCHGFRRRCLCIKHC